MPPKDTLTEQEKQEVLAYAVPFAEGANKLIAKIPKKIPIQYAGKEEIEKNLSDPKLVAVHLRAKEIVARIKKQHAIENALTRRFGKEFRKNVDVVAEVDRSTTTMVNTKGTPEAKAENRRLEFRAHDSKESALLYEEYVQKIFSEDFSDLPTAFDSPDAVMNFYEKHAASIQGLFSSEFLFRANNLNDTLKEHTQNGRDIYTGLFGFAKAVQRYADPTFFALPDPPPLTQDERLLLFSFVYPVKNSKEHISINHLEGEYNLKQMKRTVDRWKECGAEFGKGFLANYRTTDPETGEDLKKVSKEPNFNIRKTTDAEREALNKVWTDARKAEVDGYKTPEAKAEFEKRVQALEQSAFRERQLQTERDLYAEKYRAYEKHGTFSNIFNFGERSELNRLKKDLLAKGATETDLEIAKNGGKLPEKTATALFDKIIEKIQAANVDVERNPDEGTSAYELRKEGIVAPLQEPFLSAMRELKDLKEHLADGVTLEGYDRIVEQATQVASNLHVSRVLEVMYAEGKYDQAETDALIGAPEDPNAPEKEPEKEERKENAPTQESPAKEEQKTEAPEKSEPEKEEPAKHAPEATDRAEKARAEKAVRDEKLALYGEKHRDYMRHNGFIRLFMFGARRELNGLKTELVEHGATKTDLKIATLNERLPQKKADQLFEEIMSEYDRSGLDADELTFDHSVPRDFPVTPLQIKLIETAEKLRALDRHLADGVEIKDFGAVQGRLKAAAAHMNISGPFDKIFAEPAKANEGPGVETGKENSAPELDKGVPMTSVEQDFGKNFVEQPIEENTAEASHTAGINDPSRNAKEQESPEV